MVSIASSEGIWRVLHSALVFPPPSQAGRRGFESHRPLFWKCSIGSCSGRRDSKGSGDFLGTHSRTHSAIDFRRQLGSRLGRKQRVVRGTCRLVLATAVGEATIER